MVPIGIITRNRFQYLDLTLRSLSATRIPACEVLVFDDSSDDQETVRYLSTTESIQQTAHWPIDDAWRTDLGLEMVNQQPSVIRGIADLVRVETLDRACLGVVEGSRVAVRRLFERSSQADGVILLQDDVVFNIDWYERLMTVVKEYPFPCDLGVLAGIRLSVKYNLPVAPNSVKRSKFTGQCIYVSRSFFDRVEFFGRRQHETKRFDDLLQASAESAGFWAGVILPFVCQHVGVNSLVRPEWSWYRTPRGRIGTCSFPPYVIQGEVRSF